MMDVTGLQAFAAQYLAVEKELGLPRDRTNVDGGALAVGHPLGASGSRIAAHLVHELRYPYPMSLSFREYSSTVVNR